MSGLEGREVGEFKILTQIGKGGMGSVYLAEQPALNRRVAVKVLLSDLAHDPQFPKRFKREAMLAASINHPGIVQVYGAGEIEDIHYIAMEYIDGEPLQRRMEREGRIKPDESLAIVLRLAQALDYAWQKARLIHRDIKPSNVLISTEGEVKLADFGMARNADMDSNLTATGMPIGTPLYISPEQARCIREIDFTSDIYSLGCTLYHMLCGRAPYLADASFAVMLLHVTEPPPMILDHMPECPQPIVRLLDRMLAKETGQRHASYAELIEEIRSVQQQIARPARLPRRVLALAAVAVAAGAAWYFYAKQTPLVASGPVAAQKTTPTSAEDIFVQSVAALPADEQVQRVLARLKELNADFDPSTATHVIEEGTVVELAFSIIAVTDISPVRALPSLKRLRLGQTGQVGALSSIEALRGLRLTRLECYNTTISDLSPLRGMPLTWLVCPGSHITDLSPIEGCPLEALGINDSGVFDLSPLRGMPLKSLNCGVTRITDLSPLQGMALNHLNCSRTPVSDLSPLAGMPLTRLICSQTSVRDLSPLRGMSLTEIDCDFNRERDTEILRSITTLEKINTLSAAEFWAAN